MSGADERVDTVHPGSPNSEVMRTSCRVLQVEHTDTARCYAVAGRRDEQIQTKTDLPHTGGSRGVSHCVCSLARKLGRGLRFWWLNRPYLAPFVQGAATRRAEYRARGAGDC